MQTYTHLAISALIGVMNFPENYWAQAACLIGGIAPDFALMPKFMLDKARRVPALRQQSATVMLSKNIGHASPLWILGAVIFSRFPVPPHAGLLSGLPQTAFAFFLAGAVHCGIDIFTHNGKQYYADGTEPTYAWPFPIYMGKIGFYEYRRGHGIFWPPKLLEALVLATALSATVCLYAWHLAH